MRPTLRYQAQEFEHGCSIAALAIVLNKKQSEILADFRTDFSRKGVPVKVIREYLVDSGLSVIEKCAHSSDDRLKHNKRMLAPFAPVHIVTAQTVVDVPSNHSFVMDKNGKILDPGRKVSTAKDYYYVISVLGIFQD